MFEKKVSGPFSTSAYQSLYYLSGPADGIDIDFAAKLDPSELSYVGALTSGDSFEIAVRRLRLAFDNDGDGSTADSDGTDEDAVWQTLNGLRSDQRAMVAQQYRKRFGTEVREDINSEFEDNTVFGKELTKTLAYWERGGLSLAQRIHFALAGWGTDDPAIQAAIAEMRGLSAGKIAELKTEYQALFGESLEDALSGDSTLRQAIATVVDSSGWGSSRIGLVTEVAIDIANAQRPNLGTLGQAGIRNAIEERMGIAMMSMSDAVEAVRAHVATVGTNLTDAAADDLAGRLGSLQNATDVAVQAALTANGVTPNPSLVLFLRRKVNGTAQPVPWRRIDEGALPDMDLVDRAMALRMRQGLLTEAGMSGNNVAVAKVEVDGVIQYIEKLNSPVGHSEELIANEIIGLRAQGRTVVTLELFTERIPCRRSAGCRPMIAEHMPEARVFRFTAAERSDDAVEELWSIYSR